MPDLGHHARRGLSAPTRVAVDAAGLAVGGVLASLAWLRSGKAVHPHGVTYGAELAMDGGDGAPSGSSLLRTAATHPALVRFSRSLGLPRPLPDLLGVAIRVPDAYGAGHHQDVLAVSSTGAPGLRHVFLPAGDVQQRLYSSSLLYRAGSERFVIAVRPVADSPRPGGDDEFDRLARAAATGALRFELVIARPTGSFTRVGELRIRDPLPDTLDALRFNPFNCGGGLEPTGLLNRLRDYAYPLSQRAWARRRDHADEQERADAGMRDFTSVARTDP
ncbi:hypothetical protein [Paraconexibacter sp.]|uniref:hypothetical protein n=1 Tax=Paraconexibacter sp. TaxID=2949640 RepID=UPI0035643AD0